MNKENILRILATIAFVVSMLIVSYSGFFIINGEYAWYNIACVIVFSGFGSISFLFLVYSIFELYY